MVLETERLHAEPRVLTCFFWLVELNGIEPSTS